jgi:hypothetical protein
VSHPGRFAIHSNTSTAVIKHHYKKRPLGAIRAGT